MVYTLLIGDIYLSYYPHTHGWSFVFALWLQTLVDAGNGLKASRHYGAVCPQKCYLMSASFW